MGVKSEPVPTGDEPPETTPAPPEASEKKEEPAAVERPNEEPAAQIPEGKPKRRVRIAAPKKAAAKQPDLSQKTKCPVCKRVVSQHCLLYTHKCSKAALDERKPRQTLEMEAPPPPPLVREPVRTTAWVEENPDEEMPYETPMPVPNEWHAPPTVVEAPSRGHIGHLSMAEKRATYKQALDMRYAEYQHQRRANQVAGLRGFYGV